MSMLDARATGAAPFPVIAVTTAAGAGDPCLSVFRDDAGRVRLRLTGGFDDRAAEELLELLDRMQVAGVEIIAEVVDEPEAADGFAFLRLNTLARSRSMIEARGGMLQVAAAPRLERTLAAMRLAVAP